MNKRSLTHKHTCTKHQTIPNRAKVRECKMTSIQCSRWIHTYRNETPQPKERWKEKMKHTNIGAPSECNVCIWVSYWRTQQYTHRHTLTLTLTQTHEWTVSVWNVNSNKTTQQKVYDCHGPQLCTNIQNLNIIELYWKSKCAERNRLTQKKVHYKKAAVSIVSEHTKSGNTNIEIDEK